MGRACADAFTVGGFPRYCRPRGGEQSLSTDDRGIFLSLTRPVSAMSSEEEAGTTDAGVDAPAVQVVRLTDLQAAVESMVRQAMETATGSPAAPSGPSGSSSGPEGETGSGILSWSFRMTGRSLHPCITYKTAVLFTYLPSSPTDGAGSPWGRHQNYLAASACTGCGVSREPATFGFNKWPSRYR